MAKAKTKKTEGEVEVQHVDLADLKPYWNNPRDNEAAVPSVAASIERYGFTVPIVVDGDFEIIAGHTRYKAAQRLGLARVPVIVRDDWTPEQIRTFRIAENKTGEMATWDYDKLLSELRTVDELPEMQVFFPDIDLSDLLSEATGSGVAPLPDQEDIDRASDRAGRTFADRSEAHQSGYVDVTCPECGSDFAVQRDDILARSQPGEEWEVKEFVVPTELEDVWEAAIEKAKAALAEAGAKPHENPGVWRGQILEILIAEYLASP